MSSCAHAGQSRALLAGKPGVQMATWIHKEHHRGQASRAPLLGLESDAFGRFPVESPTRRSRDQGSADDIAAPHDGRRSSRPKLSLNALLRGFSTANLPTAL